MTEPNLFHYILELLFYLIISLYFSYLFWKQLLTKPVLRISNKKSIRYTIKLFIFFINYFTHLKLLILHDVNSPYFIALFTSILFIFSMFIFLSILKNNLHPLFNPFSKNNDLFSFLESIPVGIALSDHNGNFLYANNYLSQIFKYSHSEIIGSKIELLIPKKMHKDHIKLRNDFFSKPYDKQMGQGRFLEGQTKDKKQLYLEIALRPLSKKKNSKTILVIKDATNEFINQRELKKKTELLNIATLGMPSHLAYIDSKGVYKFVNQALLQNWNIEASEIIGKHYSEFLPPLILDEVGPIIENALKGKDWNEKLEISFPHVKNRLIDTYFIAHYNKHKKVKGIVLLGHDVTELNDVVQKLESTNKQLQEFAFLLSHDLRAPVRHLANFIELFLDEIEDPDSLSLKAQKYLKIIEQNTTKVQSMITGMLKIVSIRELKPVFFEIQICEFLENLYKSFHDNNLVVHIHCDEKKSLKSDPDILEHVFTNLIQNSIKYTQKEKIHISISIIHSESNVSINFQDNGPGLPNYLKTTLFEAFQKSQESDGLGLGLTIVQRSLDALGASIEYIDSPSNTQYNGVCFKLDFPVIK